MGRRKYHDRVAAIQSEQLKLVQVQRELEGLLDKVNESINALKVEELQLKSNAIAEMKIEQQPELQNKSPNVFDEKVTIDSNMHELEAQVNQQQIDLDMFLRNTKEFEEEDSE